MKWLSMAVQIVILVAMVSTDAFCSRMSRRSGAWTACLQGRALSVPTFADPGMLHGISQKEVASTV